MNLNNVKNIELLRKGLYSQELYHYAQLCDLYASVLKRVASNPDNITEKELELASKKYGPLMDAATKGNFKFLEGKTNTELLGDGTLKRPEYSEEDVEFFKLYAYNSEKLMQFRTGSRLLERVIDTDLQTGKKVLSSGALETFKQHMSEKVPMEQPDHKYSLFNIPKNYLEKQASNLGIHPDELENKLIKQRSALINANSGNFLINKLIPEHSPRWLGNRFFKKSEYAINLIEKIDPDHLPVSSTIIRKGLTPAQFGAEITGVKGNIERFFEKFKKKENIKEQESEPTYDPFTDREKDYFSKKPSEISEKIYRAAHNSRAKAITGIAVLGAAGVITLGALLPHLVSNVQEISAFKDAVDSARNPAITEQYTPMTTTELQAVINDYLTTDYSGSIEDFREDTSAALDAIQATCQTYQKNYSTPSKDEATIILDSLDEVTSKSVEQLVVYALQEAYPNYSDIQVDFFYDYESEVDGTNLEKRVKKEGFKVSFTDENGNSLETEMKNIGSPMFTEDLGQSMLNLEKSYDTQFDTFFEAISNPNATKANGEKYTYEDIAEMSTEFFGTISDKADDVRPMTVVKVKFIEGQGLVYYVDTVEKDEKSTEVATVTPTPIIENDGDERE